VEERRMAGSEIEGLPVEPGAIGFGEVGNILLRCPQVGLHAIRAAAQVAAVPRRLIGGRSRSPMREMEWPATKGAAQLTPGAPSPPPAKCESTHGGWRV